VGHDADAGQRPVEALARPVAPRDRLVDAGREQQLRRDLVAPLGQPKLIATHLRPRGMQLLGIDGVGQTVVALQLMHHPVSARIVLPQVHTAPVEAHPRRHNMHMVVGVRDHDIGRVSEAHALQVRPSNRAPLVIGEPFVVREA